MYCYAARLPAESWWRWESRAKDVPVCEATLLERGNDELRAKMLGVSEVQHNVYRFERRTSAHVELKQRRKH